MDKNNIKDFDGWIKLKAKLHKGGGMRAIRTGDVWWCAVGENVGTETAALTQLKLTSVSRLYDRIGKIPNSDLKLVRNGIIKLLLEEE